MNLTLVIDELYFSIGSRDRTVLSFYNENKNIRIRFRIFYDHLYDKYVLDFLSNELIIIY